MPTNRPTVLLVDDDDNLLHALTRALHHQPYQILTARSGQEAMWVLKANDVDVLVSDEEMPGMSGTELLAWVASNCADTMRIVLTGKASAAVAIRAINEGRAYHFFTKPCDPVQLAIMIRKAIEHRLLVRDRRQLLENNHRNRCALERFERKLVELDHLLDKDLEHPLEEIAACCRKFAEQHTDILDPHAKVLVETALEGIREVRQAVRDVLTPPARDAGEIAPAVTMCDELSSI